MFTTHSATSSTLSCVCLVAPVLPLRAGEKTNIGGLEPKQLKNEKGERFTLPSLFMVEANAMGRGATAPNKCSCNFGCGMSVGEIESMSVIDEFIDGRN